MGDRILLIGSGGREHALAWKLSQSSNVSHVFVSPGNAGTDCGGKVSNVTLNLKDFESISKWCQENKITFVMVGPEDPLAAGIVDTLSKDAGIPVFGPTASAAKIEADKSFAKDFMVRHSIPTAKFQSFIDPEEACKFIMSADFEALVVKASGLAAGKGVVVASDREQACQAVRDMMVNKLYGAAGDVVVVEELLRGPEVSVLAFSDGESVCLMPPAQDHKRLQDNDEGPNTGGMGAVCPYPGLSQTELNRIKKDVLEKTVQGMAKEGSKYVGVLYAGLMLTTDGPKVLEFNCRFGDPETQSILSLLTSDLLPTLKACVSGILLQALPTFDTTLTAAGVVVVSGGYPGAYRKGLEIAGIPEVENSGLKVFHAGTSRDSAGNVITSGGRVVAIVATDSSLSSAISKASEGAALIQFDGAFHRRDIGARLVSSFGRSQQIPRASISEIIRGLQYKDAGVDIDTGDNLVQIIKPLAKMTRRSGCDAELGGFGGAFDLAAAGLNTCDLACRTWGVGRKIKFAESRGHHYNIGFDLVAQCVNDLLTHGAEPVFFLDYFATGKLHVPVVEEVVRGMAEGCLEAGCTLIGGETAEMPGMYKGRDYDVAGLAVGAVPQSHLLQQRLEVGVGDAVIALTSSGLQHQDFTLLEEVLRACSWNLHSMKGVNGGVTLAEEILIPSPIYIKSVLPLIQSGRVKKFVCVTEGLTTCLQRAVPRGLDLRVDASLWHVGPVFGWLASMAKLSAAELAECCSCGLAAVLFVQASDVEAVVDILSDCLVNPVKVIGHVTESQGDGKHILIDNLEKVVGASTKSALDVAPENFDNSGMVEIHRPNWLSAPDPSPDLELALRPGAVPAREGVPATFDLSSLKLANPILVSGTDGVGTKLKIAQALHQHSTIGIDLVAMCVNDILASGAEPLFFTSYVGTGRTEADWLDPVMRGVALGCQLAGCALVEQHISTLPSIYSGNVYDLGGFTVGVVERSRLLPCLSDIIAGDAVIGLPSSGLHSNGFSLVRHVVELQKLRFDMPSPFDSKVTLGQDLLTPTEIYVRSVLPALQSNKIKAFAHITGGGLIENIPRVLPPGLAVQLDASRWIVPSVFGWLQYMGHISDHEMARTFNCGIGAVLIVGKADVAQVMSILAEKACQSYVIGSVGLALDSTSDRVHIDNLSSSLAASWPRPKYPDKKKKTAVLISGSGTNLQALIDHTQNKAHYSAAEITLVISNVPNVGGLARAQRAGIKTVVISHKEFKSRVQFDMAVHEVLVQHGIELVCLAGFMRILSGEMVNKWTGRMLNIHPSLLPSFRGAHAQKLAIEAGVRISGCSVHFVAEEVDAGAILVQESVPVYPGDTKETLAERIKTAEHVAYPVALEMVASERVGLGERGKLVWRW